jgi:hypothetical protein
MIARILTPSPKFRLILERKPRFKTPEVESGGPVGGAVTESLERSGSKGNRCGTGFIQRKSEAAIFTL